MAKTDLRDWIVQLHLAYRNSSKQRRFSYKRNAQKISQKRLQSVQKSQISNAPKVDLKLPSRFSQLPIASLQELLIQDIREDKPKQLQLCVPELTSGSHMVEDWEEVSGLFKNSVCREYKTNGDLKGPAFCEYATERVYGNNRANWKTRLNFPLKNEGDPAETIEILWPPLEFSFCCRAIGTSHGTITKLQQKGVNVFRHPLTGDKLPILEIDSLPLNASAIALAPALEGSDSKYFKGALLAYSIIPSRLCSEAEICQLKSLCVDTESMRRPSVVEAISPKVADGFKSDIRSVSRLLRALSSGSLFNPGLSTRSQMCSPDILRATVMSNRICDSQLKEEYCKATVLYNLYENAQRIQKRLISENKLTHEVYLSLWDELILLRLEELNKLTLVEDLNTMIRGKTKFDEFLLDLNLYNTIVNAELRGKMKPNGHQKNDRQQAILYVLSIVLTQCKSLKNIYPSLSFVFRELEVFAREAKMFKRTGNIESAQEMFATANAIVELDNIATAKQEPLKNHRIILLAKSRVPSDLARVYQFLSKVEVQITDNLDAAKEIRHSECVSKKLIRHDTYCYLYLRKEHAIDVQKLLRTLGKSCQY